MFHNKFSKATIVILIGFMFVGLISCDSGGGSERAVVVQQEEPPTIEPEAEEATPVLEPNQNEEEPTPESAEPEGPDMDTVANEPFLMPIEDIFSIRGRGTVIVGVVERGTLETNTEIEIVGIEDTVRRYVVTGIEQFSKIQEEALPGQQVGLLLRGADLENLHTGQVAAAPGSIAPHYEFTADIRALSEEEGGPNSPIFTGYRPQLGIWTLVVTGQLMLPDDVSQLLPGEEATVTIELIAPVALETGTQFTMMENDRVIATGVVTEIIR